jgi:hypothetical protein
MCGHMLFRVKLFFGAAFPSVGFLPANPLPGIKSAMKIIIGLEMMKGINDKTGCYIMFAQNLGESNVVIGKGLPFCFRKDAFARVIYPSTRNCRQSFGSGVCE